MDKKVPAHIRHHLIKQKHSKLTIQAYCKKTGIITNTFYGWRNRYRKQVVTDIKNVDSAPQVSFASLGALSTHQISVNLKLISCYFFYSGCLRRPTFVRQSRSKFGIGKNALEPHTGFNIRTYARRAAKNSPALRTKRASEGGQTILHSADSVFSSCSGL